MSATPDELSIERPGDGGGVPLRQVLTVSWTVGVVLFTLGRLLVAQQTLVDYGLNLWVFGIIDLATAVPYALGVAFVVGALIDRRLSSAGWWAVVAAASFLAPYLYVLWLGAAVPLPPYIYVAVAVLIVGFGGNAVLGIRRRVRGADQLVRGAGA